MGSKNDAAYYIYLFCYVLNKGREEATCFHTYAISLKRNGSEKASVKKDTRQTEVIIYRELLAWSLLRLEVTRCWEEDVIRDSILRKNINPSFQVLKQALTFPVLSSKPFSVHTHYIVLILSAVF